jgi:hypothetical protein
VVGDVPADDEALVMTSGISESAGTQSFRGAHRGRGRVHVFIGVSVCACCERLRLYCVILKKPRLKITFGLVLQMIYVEARSKTHTSTMFGIA